MSNRKIFVSGCNDIIKSRDLFGNNQDIIILKMEYKQKLDIFGDEKYYSYIIIVAADANYIEVDFTEEKIYEKLFNKYLDNCEEFYSLLGDGQDTYLQGYIYKENFWEDSRNRLDIIEENYWNIAYPRFRHYEDIYLFLMIKYNYEEEDELLKLKRIYLKEEKDFNNEITAKVRKDVLNSDLKTNNQVNKKPLKI